MASHGVSSFPCSPGASSTVAEVTGRCTNSGALVEGADQGVGLGHEWTSLRPPTSRPVQSLRHFQKHVHTICGNPKTWVLVLVLPVVWLDERKPPFHSGLQLPHLQKKGFSI